MKKSYNCVMLALALVFTMVSASGMEPESLISAVKKNDVKQVQELLQKGADVNQADDTGFTLLYLAVCNDNRELCRLLLAHGADVNQANNGDYTPLQGAAVHGQVDIVALLLAHGAHIPNVEDIDESQEVETIQQAVEGIIDGTFKFYKEIDKSVLMLLCMAREDDENSLAHEDYLPWDLFSLLKEQKVEPKLSLSLEQIKALTAFFKECDYEQSDPVFMQKLKEYKNSIK